MKVSLLMILLTFSSCLFEDHESPPFYDKFKREAAKRGITVRHIPNVVLKGKLKYNYAAYALGSNIYVDTTSGTWKKFPEETMMHEYGHALLNREHDYGRLPNGMYKSVMGNYSHPLYGGWTLKDEISYREEYYYDELFNPKTDAPEWSIK